MFSNYWILKSKLIVDRIISLEANIKPVMRKHFRCSYVCVCVYIIVLCGPRKKISCNEKTEEARKTQGTECLVKNGLKSRSEPDKNFSFKVRR